MSNVPSIQELIQDQLDVLPDSVREAVDSQEWRRKVYDIGRKYALKIDQLGALEQSTYYTMIGLIPSGQYISELVNQVGVARDVASSMAKEIDDQVFEDIRSFIMEMDGVNEETVNQLDSKDGDTQQFPSGAIPSREDLLSEIEAIGEPSSSPAPVVTFSPVETQLSKATASRPVDLNPAPSVAAHVPPATPAAPIVPVPTTPDTQTAEVPAPIVPVAPVLPVAPKPAPVEIPIISLTDAGPDDAGIEFTETPQGADKQEMPTDTQIETASQVEETLDLDAAPADLASVAAMPEISSYKEPLPPMPATPVAPIEIPVAYDAPAMPQTPVEPSPDFVAVPTPAPIPVAESASAPTQEAPTQPIFTAPGNPQAIPTPDGKISPTPLTADPYKEQI